MTTPDENPPRRWPDGEPVTPWADPWHDVAGDIRKAAADAELHATTPDDPGDKDAEALRALGPFIRPLSPEEAERRARPYREAGTLDRQTIMRAILGEFDYGPPAGPVPSGVMTPDGIARALFLDPGPCLVTTVRMQLDDGREVITPFTRPTAPATSGMIRVSLPAPPGGGCLVSADLLAEDGTPIFCFGPGIRGLPRVLRDGEELTLTASLTGW